MAGGIHLFKIMGMLTPEKVILKRNITLGTIEVDLKDVNMILMGIT